MVQKSGPPPISQQQGQVSESCIGQGQGYGQCQSQFCGGPGFYTIAVKLYTLTHSHTSTHLQIFPYCFQIFYYEEEEASRRDPNKDLELHQSVCTELCRTMIRIKELKSNQSVSLILKTFINCIIQMCHLADSDAKLVLCLLFTKQQAKL